MEKIGAVTQLKLRYDGRRDERPSIDLSISSIVAKLTLRSIIGTVVREEDTPESLHMEDGDQLDAFETMLGG